MTYSAANRKDVRAAQKAQLQSYVIRGEVISGVMSVMNGRQWMHELLATCHVFTDPFSSDPYIHAGNSGQRSIGIQLFADIMAFCPKQFTLMIEEHHGRSAAADERTSSTNGDGGNQASELNGNGPQHDFDYDPNRDLDGPQDGKFY